MSFLSPNQQCQSTEGKRLTSLTELNTGDCVDRQQMKQQEQRQKPCDFEYPQQPHCSQDADAERAVCIEERPDHFKQTARYHLQPPPVTPSLYSGPKIKPFSL